MLTERRIDGFSLSPQQRRLWLLGARQGGSPYRADCAILLDGAVDARALEAALRAAVERHEILRTEFRCLPAMMLPLQVVSESGALRLTQTAAHDRPDVATLVEEFAARNGFHASAGGDGPDLQAVLQTLAPDSHLLLLSLPALCMDTEGASSLLREIRNCYAACAHGEPLPEVKFQYPDLSGWMNGLLRDEEAREERNYWRKRCADRQALTRARLPFEREVDDDAPLHPQYVAGGLGAASEAAALADALGVPLSAVLLSCWQALLHRFTDESEFVLGISSGGRSYEGLDNALGLFEKYLPLECRVDGSMPARDFVRSVAEAEREAHELQEFFSWEEEPSAAGLNFIPYCFGFYRKPEPLRAGDVSLSLYRSHCNTDRFRLKLVTVAGGGELTAEFHYDPNAFRRIDVERLAEGFSAMLRGLVDDPAAAVSDLEVVEEGERRRLIQEFNYTRREFRSGRLLHQLFEEQARLHPEHVAVVCGEHRLNYAELNVGANRLARHLRALGVGPGALVPICLERSADAILCLLGVLKAAGAYVALDPAQPDERLSLMLGELRPPLALTHERFAALFEREGIPVVCVDRDRESIARHGDENVENSAAAEDLCYVLFTSGSTGRPKGVAVEHRQVLNYLHAITARLSLEPGASYATVSTLAADLGNTAIFPSLAAGGCLHLIPTDVSLSPDAFADYVARQRIDCLKIVPSHLEVLLTAPEPGRVLPEKRLVIGGEASRPQLVERVRKLKPGCTVLNHYGPSETTVGVLTFNADPSRGETLSATVPLGYPLANTQVYVLDPRLRPVPVWVTGEIYIGGAGLARGYLGHPGLTAERFIPNPFSAEPGARLYRTGDAARFLPDYSIEFLGRIDFQVKIRGYRIEIGEVEASLCAHPAVERAVVLAQGQGTGEARLVAYIVAAQGSELSVDELKSFLAKKLPDYMLPSACFVLPGLPLTPNGKVDRRALAGGRYANLELSARAVSPRNEAERAIANVWQEVLGLEKVGVYDNFFDLGGHSLLLAKVHAKLRQVFDRPLTVIDLFKYSTISSLSEFLAREEQTEQPRFDKLFNRVGKQREAINRQRQRLKEKEQ